MENNKNTIKNDSEDMNIILDFLLIIYDGIKYILKNFLKLFSLKKYMFYSLGNILHFLAQTIGFIIFISFIDKYKTYGGRLDLDFSVLFVYLAYYIIVRFIFEFIMLGFSINNKLEKITSLMEENTKKQTN